MKNQTITAYLSTIEWYEENIIDWANAGELQSLNGEKKQLGQYHYSYFDAAVISTDRIYAFIYTRLATKGLLLKNEKSSGK